MRQVFIYGLNDPHTNTIRYIGQSVTPKIRFYHHIFHAKKAKNKTYKERWIIKLLKNNIKPELKILCTTNQNDADYCEEIIIKQYKEQGYKLLNFDDKGQGNKNKIKEQIPKSIKITSKKVYQYDLNGNLIKIFSSTRMASREIKISHANISRCCNGLFKHTGGYIFKYKKTKVSLNNPNAVKKQVYKIDKNGVILEKYNSIAIAARYNNVDCGNVSKVCNKKLKSIKGLFFKFKEDNNE